MLFLAALDMTVSTPANWYCADVDHGQDCGYCPPSDIGRAQRLALGVLLGRHRKFPFPPDRLRYFDLS